MTALLQFLVTQGTSLNDDPEHPDVLRFAEVAFEHFTAEEVRQALPTLERGLNGRTGREAQPIIEGIMDHIEADARESGDWTEEQVAAMMTVSPLHVWSRQFPDAYFHVRVVAQASQPVTIPAEEDANAVPAGAVASSL